MGTPLESVTVVANVCLAAWNVNFLLLFSIDAISVKYLLVVLKISMQIRMIKKAVNYNNKVLVPYLIILLISTIKC